MPTKAKDDMATRGSLGASWPTVRDGLTPQHPGRERVTEIQRARILAAMVELSAEHGPVNVTVAHVVERAGISRRTFYELYRDREDCLPRRTFDDGIERAFALCRWRVTTPDAKWIERGCRLALTGLLAFLDVEPRHRAGF